MGESTSVKLFISNEGTVGVDLDEQILFLTPVQARDLAKGLYIMSLRAEECFSAPEVQH